MKKFINITIIILLLIAVCAVEQVLADKYLAEVEARVDTIYENFIALDDINNTKLIAQTNLKNIGQQKKVFFAIS